MHRILDALAKLLAPVLPFTAEETWNFLGQTSSVHIQSFPQKLGPQFELTLWGKLMGLRSEIGLRSEVMQKLEEKRRDKVIGKSLEARVEITGRHPELVEGSVQPADLEELFIVSKVILKPTDGEETITVTRAEDHGMKKCIRCWKYYDHVGSNPGHPELCDRCTKVMIDLGF